MTTWTDIIALTIIIGGGYMLVTAFVSFIER